MDDHETMRRIYREESVDLLVIQHGAHCDTLIQERRFNMAMSHARVVQSLTGSVELVRRVYEAEREAWQRTIDELDLAIAALTPPAQSEKEGGG